MKSAQASVDAYFARCADRKIKPSGTRDQRMQYEMTQEYNREHMAAHRALIAGDKVAQIRAAQSDLANKDRWCPADYTKNDQLSRDLRAALIDA
tara:strand:+ start:2516 stop:2797 length:282 start_codon:yes stop_codon:yes gene_type:complete